MSGKKSEVTWTKIKGPIQSLKKEEVMALVQGLFKLSVENRAFLAAHLLGAHSSQTFLQPYLDRINRAFYTRAGNPKLKLADGRKAIREYQAATSDPFGSLELMLAFVEMGTFFTLDFGDIDEPFYNSLTSVLGSMHETLKSEQGPMLYQGIRERMLKLSQFGDRIGWGYGDELQQTFADWEKLYVEE